MTSMSPSKVNTEPKGRDPSLATSDVEDFDVDQSDYLNPDILGVIVSFTPTKLAFRLSLASKALGDRVLKSIKNATIELPDVVLKRFSPESLPALTDLNLDEAAPSPSEFASFKQFPMFSSSRKISYPTIPPEILVATASMQNLRSLSLASKMKIASFKLLLETAFGSANQPGKLVHLECFHSWFVALEVVGFVSKPDFFMGDIVNAIVATCPRLKVLSFPHLRYATLPDLNAAIEAASQLTCLEQLFLNFRTVDVDYAPLRTLSLLKELHVLHMSIDKLPKHPTAELFGNWDESWHPIGSTESDLVAIWNRYLQLGVKRLRRDTLFATLKTVLFLLREPGHDFLALLKHPIAIESARTLSSAREASTLEQSFLDALHKRQASQEIFDEAIALFLAPFADSPLAWDQFAAIDGSIKIALKEALGDVAVIPLLDSILRKSGPRLIPKPLLLKYLIQARWYSRAKLLFDEISTDEIELNMLTLPDPVEPAESDFFLIDLIKRPKLPTSGLDLFRDMVKSYDTLLRNSPKLFSSLFAHCCNIRNVQAASILMTSGIPINEENAPAPTIQLYLSCCQEESDVSAALHVIPPSMFPKLSLPAQLLPNRVLVDFCLNSGFYVDESLLLAAVSQKTVHTTLFAALWNRFLRDHDASAPSPALLCRAVEFGSVSTVKFLVEAGAQVDHLDGEARNLLFFIPDTEEAQNMTNYLLERGLPIESVDKGGLTPALNAASNGKRCALWALLLAGANPLARAPLGHTIFSVPLDIVPILCRYPPEKPMIQTFPLTLFDECSPLKQHLFIHIKNAQAHKSFFELLCARTDWDLRKIDPISNLPLFTVLATNDLRYSELFCDWIVKSAPQWACAALPVALLHHKDTVGFERLFRTISQMQNPSWNDTSFSTYNRTALHVACNMGDIDAISKLIPVSDVSAIDSFGNTPLLLFLEHNRHSFGSENIAQESALSLLIHKCPEATLNLKNQDGSNPLYVVVLGDKADAAQSLLILGASLGNLGPQNMHLLHLVASRNAHRLFSLVLPVLRSRYSSDGDFDRLFLLKDDSGLTPLEVACKSNSRDVIPLFLEAGCSLNPTADHQPECTCLGLAAQFKSESSARSLVDLLLGLGADPVAKDKHGRIAAQVTPHWKLFNHLASLAQIDPNTIYDPKVVKKPAFTFEMR